jgi:hypothetical protein
MTRRLLLGLILLLLAGCVLGLPPVHWRLIGAWRDEEFYLGRPTSWWAQQVEREAHLQPVVLPYVRPPMPAAVTPRPWWQWWGAGSGSATDALLDGYEPAQPVLLELLRRDNPQVRLAAVYGLEAYRPESPAVTQALRRAAEHDADDGVRWTAAWALRLVDPDLFVRAVFRAGVK